jgi:hypothetical protein
MTTDTWLPIHRLGEGMEMNETEEFDIGDEVRFVYLAGTLEGIIQADHQHGSDWHFQIVDRKGHNHPDVDMRRITHYRKA